MSSRSLWCRLIVFCCEITLNLQKVKETKNNLFLVFFLNDLPDILAALAFSSVFCFIYILAHLSTSFLVLIVSKSSYALLSYKGPMFKNNVILLNSPYHANAHK